MYMVKETILVTRYHIVSEDSEQKAIQSVKQSSQSAEYLESCDDLHWDGKVEYAAEILKDGWQKDLKLKVSAGHIEARLSGNQEPPLTSPRKRRKMQKSESIDVNQLLERVK